MRKRFHSDWDDRLNTIVGVLMGVATVAFLLGVLAFILAVGGS